MSLPPLSPSQVVKLHTTVQVDVGELFWWLGAVGHFLVVVNVPRLILLVVCRVLIVFATVAMGTGPTYVGNVMAAAGVLAHVTNEAAQTVLWW